MRWRSSTVYAVAGSTRDASTDNTSARCSLVMPAMAPPLQLLPASRVTLINPLFVPIQMRPGAADEAEMDSIAPPGGAALPGAVGGVGPSVRTPRSGLRAVQCAP